MDTKPAYMLIRVDIRNPITVPYQLNVKSIEDIDGAVRRLGGIQHVSVFELSWAKSGKSGILGLYVELESKGKIQHPVATLVLEDEISHLLQKGTNLPKIKAVHARVYWR